MLIVCPSCATAFRVTKSVLGDAGRQVRCAQCRTVWLATAESAVDEAAMAPASASASTQAAASPAATASASPASSGAGASAGDDADWGAAFAEEAGSKSGASTPANDDVGTADRPERAVAEVESPSIQPSADLPPLANAPVPADADDGPARPRSTVGETTKRRLRKLSPPRSSRSFRLSPSVVLLMLGSALLATFLVGREQVVRTVPDSATVYERIGLPVNLRGVEFRDVKGANEMIDGVMVLAVEGQLVNISSRAVDLQRLRLAVRDAGGKEIYTWTATPPTQRLEPGQAAPFRSRLASPPPDGASVEVRFFTRLDAGGR